jgi:hypothetical protein
MNELRTLLENLDPLGRRLVLWRSRYLYLRRHPRLVPLMATVFSGPPVFFFSLP